MATVSVYIYIDNVKISDTKFSGIDDFEITSTGLVIEGTQVWTYSGNLIFDGFDQISFFPVGTTGTVNKFFIISNENVYLRTRTHANYYKASYTDLNSVANAIRNKLGVADQLEFPTHFISSIEGIPTGSADTAIIDIEVANGTATITSGEFPDWCNGSNSGLIWGSIYINSGFVAGDIDNSVDIECKVHNIFTNDEENSIVGYTLDEGLKFGIMIDLSTIGFVTNPESQDGGFVPMTSGTFEVVLIYCDPWSSGTTDEPAGPIAPSPINNDTIK